MTERLHARRVIAGGSERTAVLVLRAWLDGENCGLRVRAIETLDVEHTPSTTTAAATAAEVHAIVEHWLARVIEHRDTVTAE